MNLIAIDLDAYGSHGSGASGPTASDGGAVGGNGFHFHILIFPVSNQDHSLMQGVELVDRLLLGIPEVTYPFPGTANNMEYAKCA